MTSPGSPHPVAAFLPAVLAEDRFVAGVAHGIDDLLAPVLLSIDTLAEYLDPRLAPDDFVDWLGSWLGIVRDPAVPAERRRELLANAVDLYGWRGTVWGLERFLALATGGRVEVHDNGGCVIEEEAVGQWSGPVRVRVFVPASAGLDTAWYERVVSDQVPAHLRAAVVIEIVGEW
ncbi:phage tail protein [Dactylosporangium sp. NPDC006015]|uniref:phage tail protein n=1 Tax=Dactylosporangium sp. NPDC006015 TaxID=3154576 RepID=UPI0033AEFB67